jgi:hypothetical protein
MNSLQKMSWYGLLLTTVLGLASAHAAGTVYQRTDNVDAIELSNIDSADNEQLPIVLDNASSVVALPAANGLATRPTAMTSTESALAVDSATGADATVAEATKALSEQEQYRQLMLQQSASSNAAAPRFATARRYLKVDRATYQDSVGN